MNANKPLTSLIYDQIYRDIVDGTYSPETILTENALTERYGVSKSPVREALITLCDEQVLQSIPRTGYRVVSFKLEQLRQIAETRQIVELALLERSFPNIGEAELAQLREANQLCHNPRGLSLTPTQLWEVNIRFHMTLAAMAHNEYLQSFLRSALRINARASAQYYAHHALREEGSCHDLLIRACEAHDYAKAREALIGDANQILQWEVSQL